MQNSDHGDGQNLQLMEAILRQLPRCGAMPVALALLKLMLEKVRMQPHNQALFWCGLQLASSSNLSTKQQAAATQLQKAYSKV